MDREEKLENFGRGPWVDEVNRLEWEAYGLPCLITRNTLLGHLCGYVAVPPAHPLHGLDCDEACQRAGLVVHGGLNYAQRCDGRVCHVAKPGEPDDVWWFGFHCATGFDLLPYLCPRISRGAREMMRYRDMNFVRVECEALALQLLAAARLL
jgi:hypothetical protein